MECVECGGYIVEPEESKTENCPHCGTLLFIPSRKCWEDMKSNSSILENP